MTFLCSRAMSFLLLLSLSGLLMPGPAAGQDLAAAARKEKERRAKAKPASVPSYGTDDLAAGRPPSSGPEAAASPGASASPNARAAAREPSDDSRERAEQERYWRERARQVRARLAAAERRFAELDALAARTMIAPPDGVVIRRESWARRREELLKALEQARNDLAEARQAASDLEDEARRAGALPGWLR